MSQNRGMSKEQYRAAEKKKPRKDLVEQIKKPTMERVDDFLFKNVVEPAHKYGETAGKIGSGVAAIGSAGVDLMTPDNEFDAATVVAGPLFKILRKGKKALSRIEDLDDLLLKDETVSKLTKRIKQEEKSSKYNKDYAQHMDEKRAGTTREGFGQAVGERTKDLKEEAAYAIEESVDSEFPELFDELSKVTHAEPIQLRKEWSKYIDRYKEDHLDMLSVSGFLDELATYGDLEADEIYEAGQTAIELLNKRAGK